MQSTIIKRKPGRPRGTIKGQGVAKLITFSKPTWAAVIELAKVETMKPSEFVRKLVEDRIEAR